jgi:outer membrane protein OmpA-like peptidoglycan-associated protein
MRTTVKMMTLAAVIVLVASGCATRGWVVNDGGDAGAGLGETVDNVNDLNNRLEEAQERTTQNAEQIGQVDQRAQAANMAAEAAQGAADAAQMSADEVGGRVDGVEAAMGTLITEITINEAQGGFGLARSEVPDAARARLDQLVIQLQGAGQAAFIEIEGHTDNTGDETFNMQLGMRRAEAVKNYLYEQHNVPLHKMNTISFGESRPAAPNDTSDGRAQNRRVVVKVRG